MQRKEPLENKGVAGMDVLPRKNTLTRRANHRHISTIAPIADLLQGRLSGCRPTAGGIAGWKSGLPGYLGNSGGLANRSDARQGWNA
jgi:hypothetical protein